MCYDDGMRFRIWSLLWVIALFASAIATFGKLGLVVADVTLGLVLCTHRLTPKTTRIIAILGGLGMEWLLLTAFISATETEDRLRCLHSLKVLAYAAHTYESAHKHFPLAHTTIGEKPGHSWRVTIVPYLESTTWTVDYSQPWNSASNMAVWRGINPIWLQCPQHFVFGTPLASYFAVVDSRTVWPPDHPCRFEDIKDGKANTILLIESPHKNVKWYEPRDLSFDEAVELLTSVPTEENPVGHKVHHGFLYKPSFGINVVFADAWPVSVRLPLDRGEAIAALTAAGREDVQLSKLRSEYEPELDFTKVYKLCAFVLIALMPAFTCRHRNVLENESVAILNE